MKISQFNALPVIVSSLLIMQGAEAGQWSIGVSALVTPKPYRGYQNRVFPMPVVNYVSDDFHFHTLLVGYNLWRTQQNQLSVIALYSPLNFKPQESDDQRMKLLDRRRSTVMAGFSYAHHAAWGSLRSTLTVDTLRQSTGWVGDIAYIRRYQSGAWMVVPGIGVNWNSANQNQYYFGVAHHEARRSGFAAYKPSDSWSPYAEVMINYRINANWAAFFTGRYTRLASEIKNSPMVDHTFSGMLWTGITYHF
ncbi:MipA/OmpV family protein [Serratia microhaemolytica]|uniref:MipA/OmpV family protein n=1 Tax=Serratia microhaemolytica TaxID=2675110 RepID=UPI001F0C04B8|nr:MipA/OmpV family protein [Serratia microhaemolytica]